MGDKDPNERKFVVHCGACMHMVNKGKALTRQSNQCHAGTLYGHLWKNRSSKSQNAISCTKRIPETCISDADSKSWDLLHIDLKTASLPQDSAKM